MTRTDLEHWADTRETSIEIALAIEEYAREDMQRVWEDPEMIEQAYIERRAFEINTMRSADPTGPEPENALYWGFHTITRDNPLIIIDI